LKNSAGPANPQELKSGGARPTLFLLADAGIPMIALTFPLMLILLIPVIVTEGFLCKKWLGLSTWEAMKSNAVSNLASTIVGVPLAWAIMLGVEFATLGIVDRPDKTNLSAP
jgi:hypothetical protein